MCLCFSGKEYIFGSAWYLRNLTDAVFLCSFVPCQVMQNTLACKIRALNKADALCCQSGSGGKSSARHSVVFALCWADLSMPVRFRTADPKLLSLHQCVHPLCPLFCSCYILPWGGLFLGFIVYHSLLKCKA